MSKIIFSEDAWKEYTSWQDEDKKTLRKINDLLKAVQRNHFDGAEPLKGDKQGLYSRRINNKDRLVYSIKDDDVIVLQCKGHYDDK